MIITGTPLLELIKQKKICSEKSFDEFSITLFLDKTIYRPIEEPAEIIYSSNINTEKLYKQEEAVNSFITLKPGDCLLACSNEKINMPQGYMGLVQTKGTLARLFVSAHCSDAQVEPGYSGKVTLELINHSKNTINFVVDSPVAQIYIFECHPNNGPLYSGRYQNASAPTIPKAST